MELDAGDRLLAATAPRARPPAEIQARFAPFGIALAAVADSPKLLEALHAALAGWDAATADEAPPLRIELRVSDALHGVEPPRSVATATLLQLDGAGVVASADAGRRVARATLSVAFADDSAAVRAQVVEPLLLFLLTAAGRTPLHAAGIVADGVTLLLAGPSGSGKSCLALAAHARGLGLISDDIVYLQTRPVLRAWGLPQPIHVFPQDAPAHGGAIRLRNGKLKRAIGLSTVAQAPPQPLALLLLERGVCTALAPASPADADAAFMALEAGFDLRRSRIVDAVRRIAAGGAWHLTLSADPDEAIDLVLRHLGEIRAAACAGWDAGDGGAR